MGTFRMVQLYQFESPDAAAELLPGIRNDVRAGARSLWPIGAMRFTVDDLILEGSQVKVEGTFPAEAISVMFGHGATGTLRSTDPTTAIIIDLAGWTTSPGPTTSTATASWREVSHQVALGDIWLTVERLSDPWVSKTSDPPAGTRLVALEVAVRNAGRLPAREYADLQIKLGGRYGPYFPSYSFTEEVTYAPEEAEPRALAVPDPGNETRATITFSLPGSVEPVGVAWEFSRGNGPIAADFGIAPHPLADQWRAAEENASNGRLQLTLHRWLDSWVPVSDPMADFARLIVLDVTLKNVGDKREWIHSRLELVDQFGIVHTPEHSGIRLGYHAEPIVAPVELGLKGLAGC